MCVYARMYVHHEFSVRNKGLIIFRRIKLLIGRTLNGQNKVFWRGGKGHAMC